MRPLSAIGLAIWSLFLYVLGAVSAPSLGRIGEVVLDRFDPPKAELRMEVIEQTAEALRVYVTNVGRRQAVIEDLGVCPPNKGALIQVDANGGIVRQVNLKNAMSDRDASSIVQSVWQDRMKGWAAQCLAADSRFAFPPLLEGDRRVAEEDATLLSFEAPKGFTLYSAVGRDNLMIGSWCLVYLNADNADLSKVFPCVTDEEARNPPYDWLFGRQRRGSKEAKPSGSTGRGGN